MSNLDSLPDDIIQAQLDFYSQPKLAQFYGGMITELKREQQRRLSPPSPTEDFDTPRAQLKIVLDGDTYRIKIFKRFLTLECQPDGENRRFYFEDSDFASHAYVAEDQTWNIDIIRSMIIIEYNER